MALRVLYLGIEAELRIDLNQIEDACYALFELYGKRNAIVSIDKVFCTRVVVYGSNYEIRLFIQRTTGNALISIVMSFDSSESRSSYSAVQRISTIFEETFSTISKFSREFGKVRIYVKSFFRLPTSKIPELAEELRKLGIALTRVESRDLEENSMYVLSGIHVDPGLKVYEISIIAISRNIPLAEATLTVSTTSNSKSVCQDLVSLIGMSRALLELIVNAIYGGSNP